ncbi:MAG: hypothetical protein ABEN55_12230 [Bradymonadaceae bacterium]
MELKQFLEYTDDPELLGTRVLFLTENKKVRPGTIVDIISSDTVNVALEPTYLDGGKVVTSIHPVGHPDAQPGCCFVFHGEHGRLLEFLDTEEMETTDVEDVEDLDGDLDRVVAVFRCLDIEEDQGHEQVVMRPIATDEGEYKKFTEATPDGKLRLQVREGTPAEGHFEEGEHYRLTIEHEDI